MKRILLVVLAALLMGFSAGEVKADSLCTACLRMACSADCGTYGSRDKCFDCADKNCKIQCFK